MASLMRLFRAEPRSAKPLYEQVVARARQPHWFREGQVPDTVEGRFAMLATLLALVDLRLEAGGEAARFASVSLAECFIDDMDAELRQMGTGDPVMSKKVGSLVGALGGRASDATSTPTKRNARPSPNGSGSRASVASTRM